MKQTSHKKILLLTFSVLFLCAFSPAHVFAARVYLEADTNPVHVGDTVIINVKIDTENTTINVVKGQIDLGATRDASLFKAGGMSIADSVLTLWPEEPRFSEDGRTISFEGGVPRGFNARGATLFSITLSAQRQGTVNIDPNNLEAYLNDGKGTLASTTGTALTVNIREATSGMPHRNIIIAFAMILLICGVLFTIRRSKK